MTELFPLAFAVIALLVLSGLEILLLRLLNKRWWQKKWIRVSSLILPLVGLVCIGFWMYGVFAMKRTLMFFSATMTALTLIMILSLLLALPISGIMNIVSDRLDKKRQDESATGDSVTSPPPAEPIPRRKFLRVAAAAAPVAAIFTGASGVAGAFTDIIVYKISVPIKNLPADLHGFKILHISDIHIGYYVWVEKVAEVLEKARPFNPDIILATGDLSDRIDIYGDVLQLLYDFKAPLGVYASLGNHEYYRGITAVRRVFNRKPVPLLVNDGVIVTHNKTPIYISGADDPRYLRQDSSEFLRKTIDKAMKNQPSNAFSILMSHRPNGFDHAATLGVPLTLAGHTHGGQVGLAGRSAFETVFPEKYLWGIYQRDASTLYTSAGMGHWFPFRFNCPAEAPVLELIPG